MLKKRKEGWHTSGSVAVIKTTCSIVVIASECWYSLISCWSAPSVWCDLFPAHIISLYHCQLPSSQFFHHRMWWCLLTQQCLNLIQLTKCLINSLWITQMGSGCLNGFFTKCQGTTFMRGVEHRESVQSILKVDRYVQNNYLIIRNTLTYYPHLHFPHHTCCSSFSTHWVRCYPLKQMD